MKKVPLTVWLLLLVVATIIVVYLRNRQAKKNAQSFSEGLKGYTPETTGKTLVDCRNMSEAEKNQILASGNYACK